jgi:CheY-like chemotaxis protein
LEVSDTGCGISRENQQKIFDPFFSTKVKGHGLGLAIVERIIKALAGVIEVQSEPGSGTRFRILLPGMSETPPRTAQAGASSARDEIKRAGLVLLVEDEAALRSAVARLLKRNNFDVLEAADGTAALELIRKHQDNVELVLLDLTLPGASSDDVLNEVRRRRPATKVVVTSAYGEDQLERVLPGAKIDGFLRKPYRIAELVTVAAKLCSASSD